MTIDEAIDIYAEADAALGYENRSYGACIASLNGVVAIADESSNGSSLEMYTEVKFTRWMVAAIDGLAFGDYDDICEAVVNERPEPARWGSH
tara:strand:- start:129 stop:404 length:276 start_codon:yes stop_codon:yes gene_type:complete